MKNERYEITFLGLLNMGHRTMEELQEQIELYLRRTDRNAIVLTAPNTFKFHKVELQSRKCKKIRRK
jgi:hypothetical protein